MSSDKKSKGAISPANTRLSLKRVNFELDADQHRKLKFLALQDGKTLRQLMTEIIENLPDPRGGND